MARLDSRSIGNSDYFSEKEWAFFQDLLKEARKVSEKLAYQYHLKVFRDSRWPATGIEFFSLFRRKYIRVSLNPNFLEDKKIFFELREHTVFVIFNFFSKTLTNNVLARFSESQVQEADLIFKSIELTIKN